MSFAVFDRQEMSDAAKALAKKADSVKTAITLIKSRANDRIDAYMKANFKQPTTDAQMEGYKGQTNLYELEVEVMAYLVMGSPDDITKAQKKLAEKTSELKILPPKLSGEPGAAMYKEAVKKANASSKKQKVEAGKAAVKPLSKIGKAVEKLNKEDKSYLEKFLGDAGDAKNLINQIKLWEQMESQLPALPPAGASQTDDDKDREINQLKRQIQAMEDTACNVIEKAHDKGVVFPPKWLERLNFTGWVPGPPTDAVSGLLSARSALSTHEYPHAVYKDIFVSYQKVRWPRKYLAEGSKYGTPCPENELLEPLAERDLIDISTHEQ